MSANDLLQAALDSVSRGHAVFPLHSPTDGGGCSCGRPECSSIGKHPRTLHGLKDATLDEDQTRQWWSRWSDANLAGETSQRFVLDVDPRHGGDESLRRLIEKHGPLPETPRVRTGGGGYHHFFLPTDGVRSRTNVAAGLDVKAEGGYVVLPPSLHASGCHYEWETSQDIPLAEMPPWLMELCRSHRSESTNGQDAARHGGRNQNLMSLAGTMRRRGMGEAAIRAALLEENRRVFDPPLSDVEVDRVARSAARYTPEDPIDLSSKPEIQLAGRQDSELLGEARLALAGRFPEKLFYRDGRLVVLEDDDLRLVSRGELHDRLASAAQWVRMTKEGLKTAVVPKRLVEPLLEAPGDPIATIRRVVHVPAFVGEDFEFVANPGFDDATQTLYVGDPLDVSVPAEPSASDLEQAKAVITSWLEEFTLAGMAARAHAIALLITLVVRGAIPGRTPMFMIEAATPGTGKTLLAEVMGLAAHGRPPISTHYTRDGEEMGKRVASWVIAGRPIAFLDNLSRISGEASHVLSSIITTGSIEVRAMRELRAAGGEWNGVVIATGNNPVLSEEMPRRICRIRLNSPENPATRSFRRDDLHAWTLAHRCDLVRAVAVAVAAWKAVDRPLGSRIRPSFVDWSRIVGGILGCLDQALADSFLDPEDLAMMMAMDDGNEDLRGLFDAWLARPDALTARLPTSDVLGLATHAGVLDRVVGDGSDRSRVSRLGRYLKRHHGKVIQGHRLVGVQDSHARALMWQLLPLEGR